MRFWPRGVRKTTIDLWMKEVGTSPELIKDWKANKITWAQFKALYERQMQGENEKKFLAELRGYANEGTITLLCTDKDPERCHRSILKELIEKRRLAVSLDTSQAISMNNQSSITQHTE